MPTLTPNYKLKKPIKATENADIDVLNENMDTMDTELKKVSDKANKKETIIKGTILQISKWVKGSWSGFPNVYEYTITDSDITENDVVDINVKINHIIAGQANTIYASTESYNGYVKMYSDGIPTQNLSVSIVIQKGA